MAAEKLVLGINAAYHESAAALVRGEDAIFAIEEERLSRIKHGKKPSVGNPDQLPWMALNACLAAAGVDLEDVEQIAYSLVPGKRAATIGADPYPIDRAAGFGTQQGEDEFDRRVRSVSASFSQPVSFVPHHLAHAASAFYPSPFDEAAVMVADGIGENSTMWLGRGTSTGLERLEEIPYPHSLGMLWERIAAYLGFTEFDAPKVMGLAAYGDPGRFEVPMRRLLEVPDPDGGEPLGQAPPFRVDAQLARFRAADVLGLESLFGPRRHPGERPEEARFADVAAALQAQTELALLASCRRLHRVTGLPQFAYAGGVALNCVANARLERDGPFDALYIPPAAHDAGTALGAAWLLSGGRAGGASPEQRSPFLGTAWPPAEIDDAIARAGLSSQRVSDPAALAAQLLTQGKLVAWFTGRLELGPRALGYRSLLADPRDRRMRELLNNRVKHREPFRPFAASVLAESLDDWFQTPARRPGAAASRDLMLLAYRARAERVATIPAVLHRDNSCRIQTVDAVRDPVYHRLISQFASRTGVPLILNTSFNDNEPIVSSPEDALRTFQATDLDALFLEDRLVRGSGI
ncbi:MAG: carbamoyltransferase [Candidatus Wallbacteria bacterium]|nr:carbamoyltransferase [Candidatus Wallbacteria bacterium]